MSRLIDADVLQEKLLEIYPQAYYPPHYRKLVDRIITAECASCEYFCYTNELRKNGYGWVDWTAQDGDGGSLTSISQGWKNFTGSINEDIEVVLFHDYHWVTTNLLPKFIQYLKERDYKQIYVNAPDKVVVIELNGVTIENDENSPIYVQDSDKVEISAKKNTVNYVKDNRSVYTEDVDGQGKGAIYLENGDLKLKGTGSLNITANYFNGIHGKDDVKIQKQTLNILVKYQIIIKNQLINKEILANYLSTMIISKLLLAISQLAVVGMVCILKIVIFLLKVIKKVTLIFKAVH